MKNYFVALLLFFAGGFAAARFSPSIPSYFGAPAPKVVDLGFRPAPFPIESKPFAIVIVGRNNGAAVAQTLQSVFSQYYENFRLIYIDDASSDGSFELVRDLIYDSPHLGRTTLVRNEEKLGKSFNLARAAQACADEEIVVVLDGEDRLAHEWVLQRLNQYYADPDLWMTYGQYREYPSLQEGEGRPLFEEEWNKDPFHAAPILSSRMQTFYAALFKKIEPADLGSSNYMTPMIEMARDHFQFTPDVLYLAARALAEGVPSEMAPQTPYRPVVSLFGETR